MEKVKEIREEIEGMLLEIYSNIGCDRPDNHDSILDYVINDVLETADLEDWHSGDVSIAFRRWVEEQQVEQPVEEKKNESTLEATLSRLQEEADELMDFGDTHEKGQGHAIMRVLKEIRDVI